MLVTLISPPRGTRLSWEHASVLNQKMEQYDEDTSRPGRPKSSELPREWSACSRGRCGWATPRSFDFAGGRTAEDPYEHWHPGWRGVIRRRRHGEGARSPPGARGH